MSQIPDVAVILAAGNGSRLAPLSGSLPKPLVTLQGRPLIEHIVLAAHEAGVDRFVIVAGCRADAIRSWAAYPGVDGIEIQVVDNPHYRTRANGISVLAARPAVAEPFLLLMADHVFEPETAASLLQQPLQCDQAILAVDRKLDRIFDMEDATKILQKGPHILAIGKHLPVYNAVDTGMFLCSPAVFSALDAAMVNGDCSLSDGMRLLAQAGRLRGFDIGEASWQDVDTPEAFAHAEIMFEGHYRRETAPLDLVYA